ncbi:central glycolytic genes regulator [Bacillus oleivorans]|uniref:Central glycolytic genes regulator n=1 Tax=Bacillus oleivorans TaxID=1448271 RepID=A0A285D029_9BACI|nr:sugar-binding transcriptional regulator [Bacillus oleivorans]SNX72543.1 central glycolytic genes regulator [Bacillus oleivorans]
MTNQLHTMQKLLPDLMPTIERRYHILKYINRMQPVGRRSLAQSLGLTERVLRSEVDLLKKQGLIEVTASGMLITSSGIEVIRDLNSMMEEVSGIDRLKQKIKERWKIQDVIIVPGNSDESPWVKNELGRTCAVCMKEHLLGKNIIAVTGGTTMAKVAEMITPEFTDKDVLFVPARGGIGEDIQNQANTICSTMAQKAEAKYKVLYVPDQLSPDVYEKMVNEPQVSEVLSLIQRANIVLHGIGDAITMAKRRKTPEDNFNKILNGKAVGEAFGFYFDEQGEVVHRVQTIGIQLEDLKNIPNVIAVAGGASKAKAIRAYMNQAPSSTILITDEACALEL